MESAIIQPQQLYFYPGADLHEIAAADAFHLAESQAFIDGNKRTAIGAAMMIAISQRLLDRPGLAALLRTLFPA
ncbi:MAG: hypothetical protein JWQ44_1399 [Chthoniobacter sp.]|nr:hypothetical protein [Chthoniobacter sp.]